MIKSFLKRELPNLILLLAGLTLFALVFCLYGLPYFPYLIASTLLLFLTLISLVVRFIYYQRDQDLKADNRRLQAEIRQLKNQQSDQYRDLASYFILWVHQIKTPITAARLLADQQEDKRLRHSLKEIENYTNLAMSYLKLSEPDRDLVLAPVALDDLIRPLIKDYSWLFIDQKIQLNYAGIPDIVVTDANWSKLQIEQILNNALKYSPEGSITISYDKGQLTIADTGQGIASQDLPKLFDKGYSGLNGQLNEKSSGLGLYIVRTIADRLDQPVNIQSHLGQGTQVTINFHEPDDNLTSL